MKSYNIKQIFKISIGILLLSLTIALLVPLLLPSGSYFSSILANLIVLVLTLVILARVWRYSGAGKQLFWIMLIAFLVRLALGVFFAWALPRFGYSEPS
ncbi:MAG: hypothetical protein MUO40_03980, partial [Anaerolineaceae bacterium]|nr:hypothetical protein [Anaerolineaceae bacterium]